MSSSLYDVVVLLMPMVEQNRVPKKILEELSACINQQDLSASFAVKQSRLQEATLWATPGQTFVHNSANLA